MHEIVSIFVNAWNEAPVAVRLLAIIAAAASVSCVVILIVNTVALLRGE
jgi:hypothetical protein